MKRIYACIVSAIIVLILTGCTIEKENATKIKDMEYTVLDKDKIPEEFLTVIEEKKSQPLKLTYMDQGYLYIAQGYGAQETSGYSIKVLECYESKNAIYIHTNLIGPTKEEEIITTTTYPYLVVKMEENEKNVVFE
ncbi:MAG: protease complex subunit PrcB family protein [Lachnospiraceae bacterium]